MAPLMIDLRGISAASIPSISCTVLPFPQWFKKYGVTIPPADRRSSQVGISLSHDYKLCFKQIPMPQWPTPTPTPYHWLHPCQMIKNAANDMAWLQDELEKSKYMDWLVGIAAVVEDSSKQAHESATTAFWKALAARHDRIVAKQTPMHSRSMPPRNAVALKSCQDRLANQMIQHLAHLGLLHFAP